MTFVEVECAGRIMRNGSSRRRMDEEEEEKLELLKGEEESRLEPSEEAKRVLHRVARRWSDVEDETLLRIRPLKGAMTNEVLECSWSTGKGQMPRRALIRIYGHGVDLFFDRNAEIQTFECMSRLGQGPRLLGRFSNGRVEEFLNARTLSAQDFRDPEMSSKIAAKVREFHELNISGLQQPVIWKRLRDWARTALSHCTESEVAEFHLDSMDKEINDLEKFLRREDQRNGFCHNDLQYGNIMFNQEYNSVTLIDYEYSCYNPVAYDIANHFCEMAADYHTDTPHLLDYGKYPGLEERQRFVERYLKSADECVSNEQVENFLNDIEKYVLASHVHWGLWGLISHHVNDIDFDYLEYARQRFQQYQYLKVKLLQDQ